MIKLFSGSPLGAAGLCLSWEVRVLCQPISNRLLPRLPPPGWWLLALRTPFVQKLTGVQHLSLASVEFLITIMLALTETLTLHHIFICLSLTQSSRQTVIRFALYWNSTSSTPPQYLFDSPLYYKLRLTTVKFQRDNYNPCLAINLGAWKIVQSLVSLYCDYLSQNTTNYNNTLISALAPHISRNIILL